MKHVLLAFSLLITTSVKAQYLYQIIGKKHNVEDLKTDIDYARNTLKKNQANLYAYITEQELDRKFDSLKNTLTPTNSEMFAPKLLSVLSSIGDGHLGLSVDYSKLTAADQDTLKTHKRNGIYLLGYWVIKDKIYTTYNLSADTSITKGTEVMSINGQSAAEIVASLLKRYISDGYNTTFKYYNINYNNTFGSSYYTNTGYHDSTTLTLKHNDKTRKVVLHDFYPDSLKVKTYPSTTSIRLVQAYPLKENSQVYYLGIRSFYNNFNLDSIFNQVKASNAKTMILDLRYNGGGAEWLAAKLVGYFIDKPNVFDVLTDEQLIKMKDWKSRDKKGFELMRKSQFVIKPKENGFRGKLYVLTNGGTFSCASMAAANLKLLTNATFVGEETGGSANLFAGTIKFKKEILPNSKLVLNYNDISTKLSKPVAPFGYGVIPDVAISRSIDDVLNNRDLEMEWVMKNIEKK